MTTIQSENFTIVNPGQARILTGNEGAIAPVLDGTFVLVGKSDRACVLANIDLSTRINEVIQVVFQGVREQTSLVEPQEMNWYLIGGWTPQEEEIPNPFFGLKQKLTEIAENLQNQLTANGVDRLDTTLFMTEKNLQPKGKAMVERKNQAMLSVLKASNGLDEFIKTLENQFFPRVKLIAGEKSSIKVVATNLVDLYAECREERNLEFIAAVKNESREGKEFPLLIIKV